MAARGVALVAGSLSMSVADAQPHGHDARASRSQDLDSAPEPFVAAARRDVRAARRSPPCSRRSAAARPHRGHHVEVDGRPRGRGPADLSRRLREPARACRCCWSSTADRRASSSQLHRRRPAPYPARGVRRARLRRAAAEPARQQRLRQEVPLRQLTGLGRRRLPGPDGRRRSRHRDGRRRPGGLGVMGWSYGGFMTSWVITQTKRFKAASVGARGDEPDELHRHGRHPGLHARLLRRRVLGQRSTRGARTRRCSTSRASRRRR